VLQSVTQNQGEFYEEAQNVTSRLEFKGMKLECGKLHKFSQQDFFQKLSDNSKHFHVYYQSFSYVFRK
jgi:hypothetical protein